ncbi:hypothetical protein [Williamsia sp. 1135]|uniref:cell wall synthesis protein CwsA n=1 Tax=Williamsia sp. 1135 TaxID=1889262 RepID=UPI000A12248D|nr:hypothetical protein [Williamsia sp. 1135]ORM34548.1 hypothetical protein BFL43_11105 [Williamsia sp. 1135]
MSKLESELKAVRDRAVALSAGQRVKLGTRQSLAGLSNVTRGSVGLSAAGLRTSAAGAGAATQSAATALLSGAKKLTAQARSTEAGLAADAKRHGSHYLDKASDVFPVHITNPTVVSGLERAGLADALPEQLATTRPPSRRRFKIALVSIAVLAAGAAAFSISRRTRPQPPSVAAAPPRLADVPVAGEEAKTLDPAAPSANGQSSS